MNRTIQLENDFQQSDRCSVIDFICDLLAVLWKDWSRKMELSSIGESAFILRGECPHCHHLASFPTVSKPYIEGWGTVGARQIGVACCQACHGYILGIIGSVPDPGHFSRQVFAYQTHYPLGVPNDSVAEEIPKDIAPDFREALRCYSVDAFNATVEMCRRSLESSCVQLGADQSLKIESQIDWVKSQGKITSSLQTMAHKIRLAGNRGAHPPKAITKEEAEAVIEFAKEYFQHVYVTPARIAKFDFSKSGALKKR